MQYIDNLSQVPNSEDGDVPDDPDSFLHGDFARVPKTFLTAAPTPARPEDSKGIGPCPCRVRPVEDRGFELPGDVA